MEKSEIIELRRRYIKNCFSHLNDRQLDATLQTEGPLLILAGAGSGKTTVIVNRICNLLRFGSAYSSDYVNPAVDGEVAERLKSAVESGGVLPPEVERLLKTGFAEPYNILAITFTNKAAGEMKTRIIDSAGEAGHDVLASTFHSACARFLRRDISHLGYPQDFAIYDTDDSVRLLKEVYKELLVDDKYMPPKQVLGRIGRIKDNMLSPSEFSRTASDFNDRKIAEIYAAYQAALRRNDALDFDDLIYFTVDLLSRFPEVREKYTRRFSYVLVDEYQDTSYAQYRLVELLSGERGNVCVVGDDDQSIYRFRGATIENILGFEQHFRGAKVIRLEQNYRSTGNILAAANSIIRQNASRKGKTLWTEHESGAKVEVYVAEDERDEAAHIAKAIVENMDGGGHFSDNAVLYRMNAQSNSIETYFARAGIPYRVFGGLKFYDRAEVKDILAYMAVVANPNDSVRLTRIINRPARKIGDTTVAELTELSRQTGLPIMSVIAEAENYVTLSRASAALKNFHNLYTELCEQSENGELPDFTQAIIEKTGYSDMLRAMGDEGVTKLENVNELVSSVRSYCETTEQPSLREFLEQIALISAIDDMDESDRVTLMTLHCAKGLEFNNVYIAGLEEDIFPSSMAKNEPQGVEEERRLMYVGVTRAKKRLYLTCCDRRMLFGQTRRNFPSRFLDEMEKDAVTVKQARPKPQITYGVPPRTVAPMSKSTAAAPPKGSGETFSAGDRVRHKVFGDGTILSAKPVGIDVLLEINFDKSGVKKAMQNYAPLTRI